MICGCANRSVDDASATAESFYAALDRGDGVAACTELSATTRSTLTESAGKPCRIAVLEEGVLHPGAAEEEHTFGTSAQIRYAHDTAFLGRFPGGWQVTAAGCTRLPHHPYDCVIEDS